MTTAPRPLAEVTERGIRALMQEIGVADTARFLAQYGVGYGDYTAERDALFGSLSLEEVIRRSREHGPEGR